MPFSWRVDDNGLIVITFFGELDYRVAATAMEHMLAGNRITPRSRVLAKISDVAEWRFSVDVVRRLADKLVELCPAVLATALAFVSPKDQVYGDLRMWQALTGNAGCPKRVFRDEASALEWLNGEHSGVLPGWGGS